MRVVISSTMRVPSDSQSFRKSVLNVESLFLRPNSSVEGGLNGCDILNLEKNKWPLVTRSQL